jgi:hypothetical protein
MVRDQIKTYCLYTRRRTIALFLGGEPGVRFALVGASNRGQRRKNANGDDSETSPCGHGRPNGEEERMQGLISTAELGTHFQHFDVISRDVLFFDSPVNPRETQAREVFACVSRG